MESFISPTLLRNMREKDLRKALTGHMKKIQSLLEPRQKVCFVLLCGIGIKRIIIKIQNLNKLCHNTLFKNIYCSLYINDFIEHISLKM